MHFHSFFREIPKFRCSLGISLILLSISLNSFVDSRGHVYINREEPYRSFVAKILPSTKGGAQGFKGSHKLQSLGRSHKHLNELEPKGHFSSQKSSRRDESKSKGRSNGGASDKPNWYFSDPLQLIGKSITGYEPSDPKEPGPSVKVRQATSNEAVSAEAASNEESQKELVSKEAASEEAQSKEATSKEAASKEAASKEVSSKEAASKEAASKEVSSKEAGSKEASSKEAASKEAASKEVSSKEAGSKEASSKEAASKEAASKEAASKEAASKEVKSNEKGSEEKDPKKSPDSSIPSYSSSSSGKIRVVEFNGEEVDPNAPGWFVLKENNDFGKKLTLGTLLRKKGRGKKEEDVEIDPDNVGDSLDGNNNDTSELFSRLIRRYDKACLYLEYMDAKADIVSPIVNEATRDKIRSQNHQLGDFFLDLVMKTDIPTFAKHPLMGQEPIRAFELLDKTKEIFVNYICKDKEFDEVEAAKDYKPEKDKLLPKMFVETVYSLFLKLYSITSSSETKDYLEPEELIWIQSNLDQCNQTGGQEKKIKWFTDECKEQVLAFDQENNFACTPYMEFDFNVNKYDPILDFVWHMITSVHSHCFESFQTNTRMWHRYALAMADLFPPEMRLRWSASTEDNKKLYTRLLGPHYEVYFDNMNRCMYASNLRSNVPYLMPRFEGDKQTRYAPAKYMTF